MRKNPVTDPNKSSDSRDQTAQRAQPAPDSRDISPGEEDDPMALSKKSAPNGDVDAAAAGANPLDEPAIARGKNDGMAPTILDSGPQRRRTVSAQMSNWI